VSKTALHALAKSLMAELGADGIRINTLCPGIVRTKMAEALWKSEAGASEAKGTALGRFGDPEDMAGTVAYLLSEDARHVTGEAVIVAGGIQARF